jgi:hypothetical protein
MGAMLDKLLAALSLCALIVFMAVMIHFVREPDLFLVVVIPIGIAIYSVWNSFRDKPNGDNGETTES